MSSTWPIVVGFLALCVAACIYDARYTVDQPGIGEGGSVTAAAVQSVSSRALASK